MGHFYQKKCKRIQPTFESSFMIEHEHQGAQQISWGIPNFGVARSMKFPQCHSGRYRRWTRRILMQLTVNCNCQEEQTMGTTGLRQLPQRKQVAQPTQTTTCQPRRLPNKCGFVMNLFAYQSSKFGHVPSLIPFNRSSAMMSLEKFTNTTSRPFFEINCEGENFENALSAQV